MFRDTLCGDYRNDISFFVKKELDISGVFPETCVVILRGIS